MPTVPTLVKATLEHSSNPVARPIDSANGRDLLHDLMNHLTVIDLCVFQLRATANPSTLSALEKAADSALRTARRLASEFHSPTKST